MAKTHSRLSFDELCEEALGEMGLHPWEFYEYELNDFMLKRKGFFRGKRVDLQNSLIASLAPYMKKEDRKEIVTQAFKDEKGKQLSLKEQYERIQKKYESVEGNDLKVTNGRKRNKNNSRG